jgi:hypothetical protein
MAGLLSCIFSGCTPAPQITERDVPPPAEVLVLAAKNEKKATETVAGTDDRMLGAIFPQSDRTWFFKMSGPNQIVEGLFPQFMELLKSITFENNEPQWKLPAGWVQSGAATEFRFATLRTNNTTDVIECTISNLPNNSDPDQMTMINVNRWRGQLSLPPINLNELMTGKEENGGLIRLQVANQEVKVVNLVGTMKKDGGMNAPFMNRMNQAKAPKIPSATGTADPHANLPMNASASQIKFDPLPGWEEFPPEGFRRAIFFKEVAGDKPEESQNLVLTVISLNEQEGYMLKNINIWRQQLSLDPLEQLPAESETFQKIKLSGQDGHLTIIDGTNKDGKKYSIIAAVVSFGNETWFFKSIGDTKLTQQELPAIRKFLDSVKIEPMK